MYKFKDMLRTPPSSRVLVLCLVTIVCAFVVGAALIPTGKQIVSVLPVPTTTNAVDKSHLVHAIGTAVRKNQFPERVQFEVGGKSIPVNVEYTIDDDSQAFMRRLLNTWQPDYAAFVAIDATTGRILTLLSSSKVEPGAENFALQASFPAASIFKVITASAALDTEKANAETVVPFNGRNHTLYKKNVNDTSENRWTRYMTMREAFARSVNVFFGKLGLFYVGPQTLQQYANRYQFNQEIKTDIPVDIGVTKFSSEDPWSVVSAASGFTRDTTMSPLQGALIAAAVAHNGVMMEPYLVEKAVDAEGVAQYIAEPRILSTVVEPQTAAELRRLFTETVARGTSRRYFRKTLRKTVFEEVQFGGKTGSLTGLHPKGKCDWFVGYAIYKDVKVAVAALTVNQVKWKVKSSNLANEFFVNFLKDDLPLERMSRKNKARRAARRR